MAYLYFKKETDPNMVGLSDKLMHMLDGARKVAGVPFIITSGLRTPEHNAEVGGVADSSHLKGLAADLSCIDSSSRYAIIYGLYVAGFKRMELSDDKKHIHVDIDESKTQRVMIM